MESKRIIAIVLIVVIGVGIGVGAWVFLAPGGGTYTWTASDAPGAPLTLNTSRIIKLGMVGDTGELQGDANYDGAYMAVEEINTAGGVDIDGQTYYFGITREDTDEVNPQLVTSRGVTAARKLIYNKEVDFGIGGFRSEAVLAYIEEFMDEEIIFIGTGAATDIFCTNVIDDYANYKYFFRWMPTNSTTLAMQIIETLVGLIITQQFTYGVGFGGYGTHDVKQIGILAEDLTWTAGMIGALQAYIPPSVSGALLASYNITYAVEILTPILYDVTLNAADMNAHLATLQAAGADIVIPVISGQGGVLMMQQYAANNYDFQIFGIDVQAQADTFWTDSGDSAAYETIMQSLHRTNKTGNSIAFWDAFIAKYGHEPIYIAVGAYDAVYSLKNAIEATDSLLTTDLIPEMETWTNDNGARPIGVGGEAAWWPGSHDLVAGFPYGYTLWCQWQPDGSKNVVSGFGLYPEWLTTGTYLVAPWVHTAWTT